jgi:predicted HicB family RNase H-like nuclease
MAKKKYGTSGGVEITDAVVERLAEGAERGFEHARLRRRGPGRPPLGESAARVAQVRLPPELSEALAERAERDGTAPSAIIREALREYLAR